MYDFVIVGAGQAGLAMGYYLQKQNKKFILVDKESETGASWLNRWDSLQLFTPSAYNNLPGMDFPASKEHYPSKYEVADYFKAYVSKFKIPLQHCMLITKICYKNSKFLLFHQEGVIESRGVVIATGPFHIPYTPSFAKNISPDIYQIHSNYYKHPGQLKKGPVLVVGDGDSGFQILDEVSAASPSKMYFSGKTSVRVLPQEIAGKTLWWWFTKSGFLGVNRYTRLGKILKKRKQPVIGVPVRKILRRKNVIAVGRTLSAVHNRISTQKKELSDVKNIIWATGYKPNFEWIEGIAMDPEGYPEQYRGVSPVKDLYFIGLPWLYTRKSATLGGVAEDAEYIANDIEENFGWQRFGRLGLRR